VHYPLGLAVVVLAACRGDATAPDVVTDDRAAHQVIADLAAQHASSANDLVSAAPPRAIVTGSARVVPYSDGRTLQVPLLLARDRLRVPTDLSLAYTIAVAPDGACSIAARPGHDDLATAVAMALAGEGRAYQTAIAALDRVHAARPAAARTWGDALHAIVVDARVPRAERAGPPSWHLMFEPFDQAHGGWHSVLLTGDGDGVTMIDGKAP
jgi:hypothetical protein